jgi:DNA polymerase-3 subunit gamma/tau
MKDFIVSARKYRPDVFDTVIGQTSITDTLKNAIKNNHVAQAFLFCGPRGVGKTTCARIFAKTLNCQNITEEIQPCNACESCLAFNESRSYSIHELDAASNNSVEDIRNLTEQVRIPPQIGKYSIYIIDEVHMLSQQAFNAFLKTLEEPPSYAIFILATTEKHKIIPTILSRCQIFDFNRIQVQDIELYLEKISKQEEVEYEQDALNIIGQKADGAMRDALSIYDQILSFSGKKITYKAVIEHLNILDYEYYFKLTDYFLENNITEALLVFNDIINRGFDARNFITGLSGHFRDLMVAQHDESLQLIEAGGTIREKYKAQAKQCKGQFILACLDRLNQCDIHYNTSLNKRLHVELALIQLCRITEEKKNDSPESKVEKKSDKTPASSSKSDKNDNAGEHAADIQPSNAKGNNTSEKPEKQAHAAYKKTPSIKTTIEPKPVPRETQEDTKKVDEPITEPQEDCAQFTQDELNSKWNAFAEQHKTTKQHLHTILTSKTPVLDANNKVIFNVAHGLQEATIKEVEKELLSYLRNELRNNEIALDIQINEEKEEDNTQQKRLYTPDDKYKHMKNKNPELDDLREQFNLDFD